MAHLLYQGHGSLRIITDDGKVIYIDPYAGVGYDVPADIILVTHQHGDHNQIQKPMKKDNCIIIQNFDALIGDEYQSFDIDGITIEAVPAENRNHSRHECVGYMVKVDEKLIYFSGDTSRIFEMNEYKKLNIDYAILPVDGIYNMDAKEATECAELIGSKHAIPVHMNPAKLFDPKVAKAFTAENRLIVKAGEWIKL